jgi:protein-disulfide isomerase
MPLLLVLLLAAMAACSTADPASTDSSRITSQGPDSVTNDSLVRRADTGRIMGSANAKVWLIVVSDFQCPFCREWHDKVAPSLRKEYVETGKVRMAYLNLPLSQHQHAWPAAEVAMCAAVQGKFWPVHDGIFAMQRVWNDMTEEAGAAFFEKLALSKGVNEQQLHACLSSGALRPLIQADYDRSMKSGVRSTPTIIIGSELLPGVQPLSNYRQALDAALARVTK